MTSEPSLIELYEAALHTIQNLYEAREQREKAEAQLRQAENDNVDAWNSMLKELNNAMLHHEISSIGVDYDIVERIHKEKYIVTDNYILTDTPRRKQV